MRKKWLVLLAVPILVLAFVGYSYWSQGGSVDDEELNQEETVESRENETAGNGVRIYMMGRSVMGGWFEHWGSDWGSEPFEKEGFTLVYRELNTPPDIVRSAKTYTNEISEDNALVFFKFCFEDFWGGSREEARANLVENKRYVEEVYEHVSQKKGYKLIIGNALPKVKGDTDRHLVWNHREFNKWLKDFAEEHSGKAYIFDQYSILADGNGCLKKSFALDPNDSHPNDGAYTALDEPFFELLKQISSE